MSKAIIQYKGGIDDRETGRNLTGSQTLLSLDIGKTNNPKIVIDAGAYQGIKGALGANKEVDKDILDADFLIITHAHTDHSGMVPYLFKRGFRGKIIMTHLTKLQSKVMWIDYINLTRNEIERREKQNAKLYKKLSHACRVVSLYEKYLEAKGREKQDIEQKLLGVLKGEPTTFEGAYQSAVVIQKEYEIENISDIQGKLSFVPELLFNEEDVESVFERIETFEIGEEKILKNFHPINSGNDPKIEFFLQKIESEDYNKPIPVISVLKGTIVSKLKNMRKKAFEDEKYNREEVTQKDILKNELITAWNLISFKKEQEKHLQNIEKQIYDVGYSIFELEEKIQQLSFFQRGEESVLIDDELSKYKSYSFVLPNSKNDYQKLEEKLKNYGIDAKSDIEKKYGLKNIFGDFSSVDIKQGMKNVFFVDDIEKQQDFFKLISQRDDFENISQYREYVKQGKKIFITKNMLSLFKQYIKTNISQKDFSQKEKRDFIRSLIEVGNNFSSNIVELIFIENIGDKEIYSIPKTSPKDSKIILISSHLEDEIFGVLSKASQEYKGKISQIKKQQSALEREYDLFELYTQNYKDLFEIPGYSRVREYIQALQFQEAKRSLLLSEVSHLKKLQIQKISIEQSLKNNIDFEQKQEMLDENNIFLRSQIDEIRANLREIPYHPEDISKMISLLKSVHIDQNQDILENIQLRFFDAGHIEGSVQVVISLVVSTKKQVDNILKPQKRDFINGRELKNIHLGFSGDLGRIQEPNLAGTPKEIPLKLDYYQSESTYALREHINKQESLNKLVDSITSAKGKVVIPAFSIQRTQEILMILLEARLKSLEYIEQYKVLEKSKKILEQELGKTSNNKELEKKLEEIYMELGLLSYHIFDYDIILDSPTSEQITKIYQENCGDVYSLLDPKVQKKIFGKEIITYVKNSKNLSFQSGERIGLEEIYSEKRKDKKEIIISASGMADGGSILYHLKQNLPNPLSKIVFIGYTPESTKGGIIKAGARNMTIDGEDFEILCEHDDIAGFSGHIDQSEILYHLGENIHFKKGAMISLTHGDEKRYEFSQKVKTSFEEVGKKIEVIVPKLGEKTIIPF